MVNLNFAVGPVGVILDEEFDGELHDLLEGVHDGDTVVVQVIVTGGQRQPSLVDVNNVFRRVLVVFADRPSEEAARLQVIMKNLDALLQRGKTGDAKCFCYVAVILVLVFVLPRLICKKLRSKFNSSF